MERTLCKIEALDHVIAKLPRLADMVANGWQESKVILELPVEGGTVLFIEEHYDPLGRYAIARASMPQGVIVPYHKHDGTEWLMVYEGEIEFQTPAGMEAVMSQGFVVFLPGIEHKAKVIKNTLLVAVTMPADPGYPHRIIGVPGCERSTHRGDAASMA